MPHLYIRIAQQNDADTIAHLHARSWQMAYKGILSDAFLEDAVFADRQKVWQERFETTDNNRCIFVAVEDNRIVGFVCIYGNNDAKWGALIDNLHVSPDFKGRGIGKRLIDKAAKWIFETYQQTYFYLWVYADNKAARQFYEKIGGENVELDSYTSSDGTSADVLRYAWR